MIESAARDYFTPYKSPPTFQRSRRRRKLTPRKEYRERRLVMIKWMDF